MRQAHCRGVSGEFWRWRLGWCRGRCWSIWPTSFRGWTGRTWPLVLAALAHAGGSHEQSDVTVHPDELVFRRLPPLVAWPAAGIELAS